MSTSKYTTCELNEPDVTKRQKKEVHQPLSSRKNWYLYEILSEKKSITGFLTALNLYPEITNRIYGHEKTLGHKVDKYLAILEKSKSQDFPVTLFTEHHCELSRHLERIKTQEPVNEFKLNGVSHRVWKIDPIQGMEDIDKLDITSNNLYITDGHHRYASALKLAETQLAVGKEPNKLLVSIFPEHCIKIRSYYRACKHLNGLTYDDFLLKLTCYFEIAPLTHFQPAEDEHSHCLFIANQWWKLKVHNKQKSLRAKSLFEPHALESLEDIVFKKILKLNKEEINGCRLHLPFSESINTTLNTFHAENAEALFVSHPVTKETLKHRAALKQYLPPHSTWIEPRVCSGFVMQSIFKDVMQIVSMAPESGAHFSNTALSVKDTKSCHSDSEFVYGGQSE